MFGHVYTCVHVCVRLYVRACAWSYVRACIENDLRGNLSLGGRNINLLNSKKAIPKFMLNS